MDERARLAPQQLVAVPPGGPRLVLGVPRRRRARRRRPGPLGLLGVRRRRGPVLHVVPGELAERLQAYVADGGHLVATYFSGIVDENDHIHLGGYPGRSPTSWVSGSRSSHRCSRVRRSCSTTATRARSGPSPSP
ncbi:beta-galactosidase trimerization domain-containing protein [Oerskovia sp. M15]